jgi:hypothetical protein
LDHEQDHQSDARVLQVAAQGLELCTVDLDGNVLTFFRWS